MFVIAAKNLKKVYKILTHTKTHSVGRVIPALTVFSIARLPPVALVEKKERNLLNLQNVFVQTGTEEQNDICSGLESPYSWLKTSSSPKSEKPNTIQFCVFSESTHIPSPGITKILSLIQSSFYSGSMNLS